MTKAKATKGRGKREEGRGGKAKAAVGVCRVCGKSPGAGPEGEDWAEEDLCEACSLLPPMPEGATLVSPRSVAAAPNHREADPEAVRALARSMRDVGLLQPVGVVRLPTSGPSDGPTLRVVFGHSRLAAARLLGWPQIPVTILPQAAAAASDARCAALEHLPRRALNPVEEAVAVAALLEAITGRKDLGPGLTAEASVTVPPAAIEEAAALLGRSPAWVRDRAILLRLSPVVRAMVADGSLPLGQAREIATLADARTQAEIAGYSCRREDGSGGSSVEQVKNNVAFHLQTLRGTRWELDRPFAGRAPCTECPHNTANAQALFAAADGEALEEARCLDKTCYAHKTEAAKKAFEKAVAAAKKEDVPSQASAVRDVVPDGLKVGAVVRQLKKDRGEMPPPKRRDDGQGGGTGGLPYDQTAQGKYNKAMQAWVQTRDKAFGRWLIENDLRLACWLIMPFTTKGDALSRAWGDNVKRKMKKDAEAVVAHVVAGTSQSLFALLADVQGKDEPENLVSHSFYDTEFPDWFYAMVVEAAGLDLPPQPQRDQFKDGPDESATAEAKPAKKAKAKRKKKATAEKAAKGTPKAKAKKAGKKAKGKKAKTAAAADDAGEEADDA